MGRHLNLAWVVILITLFSATALGEKLEVKLYFIPEGTPLTLPTKEMVRYFTLQEYLELVKVDNRLKTAETNLQLQAEIDAKMKEQLGLSNDKIGSLIAEKGMYEQRSVRLDKSLAKCEIDLVNEQSKFSLRSALVGGGIGFAGGVALTAIVLITVFLAR